MALITPSPRNRRPVTSIAPNREQASMTFSSRCGLLTSAKSLILLPGHRFFEFFITRDRADCPVQAEPLPPDVVRQHRQTEIVGNKAIFEGGHTNPVFHQA